MAYTLPISVSMAALSFGLTKYYSGQINISGNESETNNFENNSISQSKKGKNGQKWFSNITFILIYLTCLVLCATVSIPRVDSVYASWNSLGLVNTIGLGAGIILGFFLPGYAVILLVLRNNRASPILKVLLGYLCSMLITGLVTYIAAISSENDINQNKFLLISVYVAILVLFMSYFRIHSLNFSQGTDILNEFRQFISNQGNKIRTKVIVNLSEFIVFASLFALLTISTYYLYGGITIGDQWYHQNRAIFFMHGNFREIVSTDGDQSYTPLLSSLLAGVTSISSLPLINTYASIAFLNFTPVFAFYYFCRIWFPLNKNRAALLGATFFVLASGFGWAYVLYLTTENPGHSPIDSIAYLIEDKIRVTDIRLSSNFMIAAFPDYSTGLTLVTLPAGFVLLGLTRVQYNNKLGYIGLISLVSISGILFHDEFYLFILVSSILPLIFNLKEKSYLYYALLISFTCILIIDSMFSEKYFTAQRIFGIPIIELAIIFILGTFSLYLLHQRWFIHIPTSSNASNQVIKKIHYYINKIRFIPKILLVTIVVYACALCFLVWIQLPSNYVNVHTQNYETPWYMYGMRLGGIGLLGIAFLLSHLFKKFEREVFVFGLIIVIALAAGPYYNEHRFSKYVMVGMIGFASLMMFKLLRFLGNQREIVRGVLIGSIVVITSLSTLMYIGYNALVVQTQDYENALGRRNFPTSDEMRVLDLMRTKIQEDPERPNVATFASEYSFRQGDIISKLHAFSGLPLRNAIQTQYLLNASTLDSFHRLAVSSNTGYLLVPTHTMNQTTLTDPLQFAFDNFPVIHKDKDYLVLDIPSWHRPSTTSESKVGVIEKDELSPLMLNDTRKLPVNNTTFDFENDTPELVQIQNLSLGEKVTLNGYKNNDGKTFWSKDLNTGGIDYIELSLRSLDKTNSGKGTLGLKWAEGNKIFFASLSEKGLQLREQTINEDGAVLLSQNAQVKNDKGIWYLLKIESLSDSINVYVDNLLKIKVPRNSTQDSSHSITKIGINSEDNIVEFGPVLLGKVERAIDHDDDIRNFYYYALTSLALSRNEYEVYSEHDQSVFSNKYIILPFDSQDLDTQLFKNLLNYTRSGGTLVVINSDDKFEGKFSKLFSISPSATSKEFTGIARNDNQGGVMDASGAINDITVGPSTSINVLASYVHFDNGSSIPFAIEMNMSDKGRIIYINGHGYFDSITNNPKMFFSSLANFSEFFELDQRSTLINENVSEPIRRFIGDASMTGKIFVNSSSFLITNGSPSSSNISIKNIMVSDKYGTFRNEFKNLSVVDIKLAGEYNQLINTSGQIMLPSTQSRQNYLGMSLPNGFNMTVNLLNNKNSRIDIITNSSNLSNRSITLDNESKIDFYKIESESPYSNLVPIVVRNPEITVNGSVFFEKTNFYGQEIDDYIPLNVSGIVKTKFSLTEDFKEPLRHGTKLQYLTYLDTISIDGKRNQVHQAVQIPGDISPEIKKRGLDVPLLSILSTTTNYIILAVLVCTTIALTLYIRRIHAF